MPRLFLGNLGHDCRQRDIERLFEGFGELRNINLKGQYGFIEVESKEDASDAVRKVNGQNFNGGRIRVELANACSDSDPRDSGSRARVSDGRYRRTNYRIIVRNLSSRTSWQVPFVLVTSLINHYICVCSPVHLLSVQNITFTFSTALCWWCTPVVHVCPLGPLGFLFLGPPEHRLALLQSQKSISVLTSISPSCINLASLTTRSN